MDRLVANKAIVPFVLGRLICEKARVDDQLALPIVPVLYVFGPFISGDLQRNGQVGIGRHLKYTEEFFF